MTYEQWQDLQGRVSDKFQNVKKGKELLPEGPGEREYLECDTPAGRIRLELWMRPVVLERKTLYTHRMNTAATVQYRYDESEHSLTLHAYRWDGGEEDWHEVKAADMAGAF